MTATDVISLSWSDYFLFVFSFEISWMFKKQQKNDKNSFDLSLLCYYPVPWPLVWPLAWMLFYVCFMNPESSARLSAPALSQCSVIHIWPCWDTLAMHPFLPTLKKSQIWTGWISVRNRVVTSSTPIQSLIDMCLPQQNKEGRMPFWSIRTGTEAQVWTKS